MMSFGDFSIGCFVVPLAGYTNVLNVHLKNQFEGSVSMRKKNLQVQTLAALVLDYFGAQLKTLMKA